MKKAVSVLLTVILMGTFLVGCGEKSELYGNVNLKNYVELGKYKGIEVDTESQEYAKYYVSVFDTDVEDNSLYNELTEGVVADGDIINLDYEGKIDGIAFDGGTAQGYELTIGSNKFIDGFEEALIGAKVGETTDVNVTFPENYGKEDLNGKAAVFTCKINYIKKPMTEEEAYKKLDFDSAEDYIANINERAIKNYLLNAACENAKIKDYPEADSDKMVEAMFEQNVEMYKKTYNVDFEELLTANGYTIDTYKEEVRTTLLPTMMNVSMVAYSILREENLELLESTINSQSIEQKVMAENYAVQDTVLNYLYEEANIK